ncbi:hypothetical protein CDD83_3794 [Cordyceps sp. RAO-2017]|nr:hypothetical protein CDD83_3794 [Cordyceps sp. RAO-2017]
MRSVQTFVAAVAAMAGCVAGADGNVIRVTAQSDNSFNPSTVIAKRGDVIEFHFQPNNHSVVSGSYESPCSPMQLGSGFYSGFLSCQGGEAGRIFRVTVRSEDPMPFYSSQGDECPRGMVGLINPNGQKTLDEYRTRAKTLSRAVTPGTTPYGGELEENTDPSAVRNPDGTVRAAAGALAVPVTGLAAAVAMALLMA